MTSHDQGLLELADEAALADFIYETQNYTDCVEKARKLWPLVRALSAECGVKAGELADLLRDHIEYGYEGAYDRCQQVIGFDEAARALLQKYSIRSALVPGVVSGDATVPSEGVLEGYVVRKRGYFYRPNAQGYTASILEAGRWTEADARRLVEGVEGASVRPASDFPVPVSPSAAVREALEEALDRMKMAVDWWNKGGHALPQMSAAIEMAEAALGLGESSTSSDEANDASLATLDDLDYEHRLAQESPGGVITSAELLKGTDFEMSKPFNVGPFPPEMRQFPAADREAVARIIDPDAWTIEPWNENWRVVVANRKEKAFAKADAILSTGAGR